MEGRANILRQMEICRFCLTESGPLTNIYEKQNNKEIKQVPLPLQLMSCIAIEVFPNDGMPQLICRNCTNLTLQAYTFKTNCKKVDDALKHYLATGNLKKPELTFVETNPLATSTPTTTKRSIEASASSSSSSSSPIKKKILNFSDGNDEENIVHIVTKMEEDDPLYEPSHIQSAVKTDCFPCPDCERSFPLKQLLELHRKNHDRERNYICVECDKAFFNKYDLNKHLQTHTNDRPFSCIVCSKSFARESLLHRHEKVHVDVPKYLCTECDRTFLSGEDLDSHNAKQHKKYRPFSCKLCNKSFVFKQGLERHIATHSTVKPHKCNYCEASFNSAIKLTRHVTSHAGLRPYPCKICGRTFLLSHHLTRHLRSHYASQTEINQPIGQHKCDVCSMSFRRKDSLINHSAIHSMVNLKCVICNTEFDNVTKVKEHITTHLSGLPFPCEKCDYSFETIEQLEDHELKHAEMEYEDIIEQEVLEEERKKKASSIRDSQSDDDDNDDDNGGATGAGGGRDDSGDDDIAEFTITNDLSNPEVVRRSKRLTKINKSFADFFTEELDDETKNTTNNDDDDDDDDDNNDDNNDEKNDNKEEIQQYYDEIIKPIVRSEGTKVYTRKTKPEKPKLPQINLEQLTNNNQVSTTLLDVPTTTTNNDLTKLPNKEVFNMKIGDKTVVVQKLVLTKEQMQAMAKEGKLEKKGNTYLLRKNPNINLDLGTEKPNIINFNTPLRADFDSIENE